MTPLTEKLVEMLREKDVELADVEWEIRRLYPSRTQKSAGAWIWTLFPASRRDLPVAHQGLRVGSIYTVTDCVKHGIEVDIDHIRQNTEVFPLRPNQSKLKV